MKACFKTLVQLEDLKKFIMNPLTMLAAWICVFLSHGILKFVLQYGLNSGDKYNSPNQIASRSTNSRQWLIDSWRFSILLRGKMCSIFIFSTFLLLHWEYICITVSSFLIVTFPKLLLYDVIMYIGLKTCVSKKF